MIADQFPRETCKFSDDSFWRVRFTDGSEREEADTSWTGMSEPTRVDYFGGKKSVMLCKFPVERIWVFHDGLQVELEVPAGARVYQAIRASMMITGGVGRNETEGRVVGLVKEGEVIDERYLNGIRHIVVGLKM